MGSVGLALLSMAAVLLLDVAGARAEVVIGLAAPLTGSMAWGGAATQSGAQVAVEDLNAQGGVLGEHVEMITADDYCDADQAVDAARKLIEAGVVAVVGHQCSGAAIAASQIYAEAGIVMISDFATNPRLTEQGLRNVFRVLGRDDLQGRLAGDLLAERWAGKRIAILHDGQAYGQGLAAETKKRLNERGVAEALIEAVKPGEPDYTDVVRKLQAQGVKVLYYGGYMAEAALILRQAHESGYDLQLVAGDGISSEDFALIAGPAADGTLMTAPPEPPATPEAAALTARFSALGTEGSFVMGSFTAYAAIEVWAQAVEEANTFDSAAVAEALRTHVFDTVLGKIGFDAKGDVTGYDTFIWYVWRDGDFAPAELH